MSTDDLSDAEFLSSLQTRSTTQPIVFLSGNEVDRLRELTQRIPLVIPAAGSERYAMQATTLHDFIRAGHRVLSQRVLRQLTK